jgi:hypothetical protein
MKMAKIFMKCLQLMKAAISWLLGEAVMAMAWLA